VARHGAQRILHSGDPPGGHTELAYSEAGQDHRGLGVAGQLAAHADSAAIVYWVRSLVPTEKKSTSRANASACTATAGTSSMIPTSMSAPTIARAVRSSSSVATIGNMTFTGWRSATAA